MNIAKSLLFGALVSAAFFSHAASWQDSLSSAASQLNGQNGNQLSSLGSLLNGGNQALSADTMNNAAGILQYCAKQKLASVTSTENIKNQVLDKLGLNQQEQKEDTNYLEGIQGLLNTKNGEQLNLSNLGDTPLAQKVKTKACDIVLKQGVNFLS